MQHEWRVPNGEGQDGECRQGRLEGQESVLLLLRPRNSEASGACRCEGLLRGTSVSGAATMLYLSTNCLRYPVMPKNARSSSTVTGGASCATAAILSSADRTPCRSITMPTNSKLEQHHLDFGKSPKAPPLASRRKPLSLGQGVVRNPRCNSECRRDNSLPRRLSSHPTSRRPCSRKPAVVFSSQSRTARIPTAAQMRPGTPFCGDLVLRSEAGRTPKPSQ